jgi:hypothetical protein
MRAGNNDGSNCPRKILEVLDMKGTPLLYIKLQKALCRLMRASLFFYRKLRKKLEEYWFKINPYDPCVANKGMQS